MLSSLGCSVCVCSKGMVEVVAENYHNIWAKKKKSDLGSRGDSLMKSITADAYYAERAVKQRGREPTQCSVGGCKVCVRLVNICVCLPGYSLLNW